MDFYRRRTNFTDRSRDPDRTYRTRTETRTALCRPSSLRESYGITATLHPTSSTQDRHKVQVPSRVPTPMDFTPFRESGELSDITVQVGEKEFKLHKFPLYTKSDFFRALARADSGKVELDEFPGGPETFEVIANYCYNKRIDVDKDNICKIRCAAEFLQMCSPGNLAECADRYLIDILTTAKLTRDIELITSLVLTCRPLGAIAEQANIIERCVNSIVDCWLLSSKWTRRAPSDKMLLESPSFKKLSKFPLSWFKQLFITARDKNVRGSLLVKLVQSYIADKIKKTDKLKEEADEEAEDERDTEEEEVMSDGPGSPVDHQDITKDKNILPPPDNSGNDDDNKEASTDEIQEAEPDNREVEEGSAEKSSSEEKEKSDVDDETVNEEEDSDDEDELVDIGVVMDTLLLELPDRASLTETIEPRWAITLLRVADELKCQCRDLLLKLAARILYRFSSDDLSSLSPELLEEIVKEAAKDPLQVEPDAVSAVVDSYLLELAHQDKLTVDVFNRFTSAVPSDHRQNHDVLFKVLESLLKSGNVEDSEKESLLNNVDFRRLSESALQNAYESQLVPDPFVTKAALALCAKLRHELETARDIIRTQQEELDRQGLVPREGRASSWLHGVETDYGLSTSQRPHHESREIPSRYRDDLDLDSLRYSPPGVDPILEKGLGGRYYNDPFNVDALYPYCYHHETRRSRYDDEDEDEEDTENDCDPYDDSGYVPRYSAIYSNNRPAHRSYQW